jgi:transcriptional regulator with XRE-family HTH domain
MDRSYVGGIERGERNVALENILRLADGLGVTPAELMERYSALARGVRRPATRS